MARELVSLVYRFSSRFPVEERYNLTSQIRSAAVSVSLNIAEGCGRSGDRELARFVDMASGSLSEVEQALVLAADLGYGNPDELRSTEALAVELRKMLARLLKYLRR